MKKIVSVLAIVCAFAVSAIAADMTTVWTQLKGNEGFMVADIAKEKASKNGFEDLTVALNSAPTSDHIKTVKNQIATIDDNQKITTVNQNGIEVSVFTAPAAADGSLYKLLIVVNKNDNAEKALVVLYGTCTPRNLENAMQSLSLEDIIGG